MIVSEGVSGIFNPVHVTGNPDHAFFRVGITGGIGSGKSFVCRIFSCLGIPVYDADKRARWLTEHHPTIKSHITDLLGSEAYLPSGTYNRQFVSSVVFETPSKLQELNRIIHPIVGNDADTWMQDMQDSARFPYGLKEAAIMNKAGEGNNLDFVITVTAPEDMRIKRVLQRDKHRTESDIRNIIANQKSENVRLKEADFVIHNDGIQPLLTQVLNIHTGLLQI